MIRRVPPVSVLGLFLHKAERRRMLRPFSMPDMKNNIHAEAAPSPKRTAGTIRRTESRLERYAPDLAEAIRRNPPQNLTIAEAAAFLSMSPRSVQNHIAARRLSVTRIGGSVRLRLPDLLRDLEKFKVAAAL